MTLRSGLNKSIGLGLETTYGVAVAPTVWFPFKDDALKLEVARLMSDSVIAGARLPRSQQWSAGNVTAGGTVDMELYDRSIGKLLRVCLGSVSTAGPVNSLYTHTLTPGDLDDDFFTLQVGRPDILTGSVNPFSYSGCVVKSWEIGCEAGNIATFQIEVVGRDEILYRTVADGATTNAQPTVTSATAAFGDADLFKPISGTGIPASSFIGKINSATSIEISSSNVVHTPVNASATGSGVTLTFGMVLTAVSYATGIRPMTYVGGSASIAGTSANVKSITVGGDNPITDDRRFVGRARIVQPVENGLRDYGGTIQMEFESEAQYLRYLNANEVAVVFAVTNGSGQSVTFTLNTRFDGSTPELKGTDPGEISIPFKCIGTTTDAAGLTVAYVTTEATP